VGGETHQNFCPNRSRHLPRGNFNSRSLRGLMSSVNLPDMDTTMTTTAFELHGYRIVKSFGVVRGIIVRSRSIFGTIGAGLQTLVGGNITILTDLCEKTREHALELCLEHARQVGANAIVGLRYDATEIMQGVTEVLCYGTAVLVEPNTGA
jgi:uncharacterized protein YbjQ (UPF0145 family)